MKVNHNIKISGTNVILVPYTEKHVPRYHKWMQSEELQRLTASEPLSLEQEYEMQKSWREDEDKCTFIILDKHNYEDTNNEIESMIGDTNIFITNPEDKFSGEAEIMIAEISARRKRRGWEAMLLMLRYGIEELGMKTYEVKISTDNISSIKMFQQMEFEEVSQSEVFKEITLSREVTEEWKKWIHSNSGIYNLCSYESL